MIRFSDKWHTVYAKDGRAVGRYCSPDNLLADEIKIVRDFLCKISKQKGPMEMSKQPEATNMVFIAGIIRTLKVRDDGSGFALVDVGDMSKYIPCTVYENKELSAILSRFREKDFIQVQGFVRAWSQKKDDGWKNNMDVRITHIKNKPPVRETPKQSTVTDDDIPF